MKLHIYQTKRFVKDLADMFKRGRLLNDDFEDLKMELTKNPKAGDVIVGTGGVRKIRIKSSSGGKSGGLRLCYFYYQMGESIYLLWIYAKNNQEDLTQEQRKILKELVYEIKKK